MRTIVLASASPRRKELLKILGLKFEVEPANIEEEAGPGIEPHQLAKKLSLEKARTVARNHGNALIIAADTFVVLDSRIMGKPGSGAEAREMLQALNGRQHLVITGFTIIDCASDRALSRAVETRVYFRRLAPEEIEAYIKSGEPLGKAGAYAIQGLGAAIVEKIEGDFFNVVGLPLNALAESLKEFGVLY